MGNTWGSARCHLCGTTENLHLCGRCGVYLCGRCRGNKLARALGAAGKALTALARRLAG